MELEMISYDVRLDYLEDIVMGNISLPVDTPDTTAHQRIVNAVSLIYKDLGYAFYLKDTRRYNGQVLFGVKIVTINPRLPLVYSPRTYVHELAHALFHTPKNYAHCRYWYNHNEIEAETITYIVNRWYGTAVWGSFAYLPYIAYYREKLLSKGRKFDIGKYKTQYYDRAVYIINLIDNKLAECN